MQIKIAITLLLFTVEILTCYAVLYPVILRRSNVWPVTLYGRVSALSSFLIGLTVMAVFWQELVLRPASSFIEEYGLRIGLALFTALVSALFMFVFRTARSS